MGEKANNNKKQPQKKKIIQRAPRIHTDTPRIVARQDETYRPVRQLNEAVNMNFEKAKSNAVTPRQRTRITHAQENYNVKQRRQRQVTSRGYDNTRREKQQHKSEDTERKNRQYTVEQFSSNIPYSITNSIENARKNQAQLWDKDKVDNTRNMQNMVNRDFLVMPGYQSMISAYNPYTQSQEIGQTFSDATRLHGYVNAAQMATAAGMTPLKFGLSLGAMYAGNKIGDKAVDLGMKQFTPYNSWYDYANKKWGYNEQEAQRSNPGGWVLGGLGLFLGPKLANTKPFIPLRLSYELSDPAHLQNVGYISTSEQNPATFNRFRLGDLEINNPGLNYRQGGAQMGEDFLKTGVVNPGLSFKNPMFAEGKLFYGTKDMLQKTQPKPTPQKGRVFLLTKDKDLDAKIDVLVSTAPMRPAGASSLPVKEIVTDNYTTSVNTGFGRRIPVGEANSSNTTLYRYDPSYGFRKLTTQDPLLTPFDKPLVDQDGNLLVSVDEILSQIKERIPFGTNPEEIINKGFGGRTNLKEHIEAVVKSAQEYPLPEGVSRQDFVTSALYHDLGKVLNPSASHGGTSNYIVDLMGWPTNKAIQSAISNHMQPQSLFVSDSNLAQGLHAADVGRGRSFHDLLAQYSYLEYPTKTTSKLTLTKHLQGDAAIKMFKEYGGEPIPEGSINGEQLRRYVPEARERYGIVGDTRITDEEIAQALYKHVKELGGNTAAKNQQGEPQLLFRGDTKPYTELRERISPEKASTMGGTMDNSLGTLFLGEMPNSNAGDAGVLKYLNYGSYVYDPQENIINVVWRPSQTGGASIKIGNKVYTNWFDSPNMSKEPSIANIPDGSTLVEEHAIPGTEFTEKKYKLPLSITGTEAQDINAFVVKTPSTYNMSNQMQVLGQSEALDPRYNFQWLTDETPRAYLDKDGFPLVSYKGNEYPNLYGNEARPLWADQYRAILDNAQNNNAGLLISEPMSPFRNEHRGYTYAILPNSNIRGAKHILPYDLRIPRNWNDKNIYRVLFPLGIGLGTMGVNNSDENKNQ